MLALRKPDTTLECIEEVLPHTTDRVLASYSCTRVTAAALRRFAARSRSCDRATNDLLQIPSCLLCTVAGATHDLL